MLEFATTSYLNELKSKLGTDWPTIFRARANTAKHREELVRLITGEETEDANVVVYGSMARSEMTHASDLDWTLLLDKPVDPSDISTSQRLADKIRDAGFADPGKTNIFGSMTSSHSLVHHIGGQDDTNANTTRRVLLLLESYAPGKREA